MSLTLSGIAECLYDYDLRHYWSNRLTMYEAMYSAANHVLEGFKQRNGSIDWEEVINWIETFSDRDIVGYTARGYPYDASVMRAAMMLLQSRD